MKTNAMLAHHYQGEDVVGWYASRKLNGWRMIWDGSKLWTLGRYSGPKTIEAPDWFYKQLPHTPLDGELWHPSDDMSFVKSIAGQGPERSKNDPRWHDLRYMVFNIWYSKQTWLDNYKVILKIKSDNVEALPQARLTPGFTIYDFIKELPKNAEGAMIVDPYSYYECKRSRSLLKVKKVLEIEATVIGVNPGEGKHKGRMGSLEVSFKWDDKVTSVFGGNESMVGTEVYFCVGGGFTDEEREQHWTPGQCIKFSYLGVTNKGVPISPNFIERV